MQRGVLLSIDTSTSRGSVALLDGDALVLDEVFSAERSHTSTLFPILERARMLAPRLTRIAVGLGPGSYAGIRIAIAAAHGVALGTGAQLVGLPSVAGLECDEPRYLCIGDARRETFYFTRVEEGLCTEGPLLLDEASLRARMAELAEWPVFSTEALALFPQAKMALPLASRLARLAAMDCGVEVSDALEPLYLREPHITMPRARLIAAQ